jgi:hypothetical protein
MVEGGFSKGPSGLCGGVVGEGGVQQSWLGIAAGVIAIICPLLVVMATVLGVNAAGWVIDCIPPFCDIVMIDCGAKFEWVSQNGQSGGASCCVCALTAVDVGGDEVFASVL